MSVLERNSKNFCLCLALAGLQVCALFVLTSSSLAATWKIQTTPNATGAEHSALSDIACAPASTNTCVSVGRQTASGGTITPYAQTWNGSSWTNQTVLLPAGGTAGELQATDCFEEAGLGVVCFAAGSYVSSGVTKSLVELSFVGFTWESVESPNPEGASETAFKGISCRGFGSACVAVGYSVKGGVKSALIERFGGSGWTIQSVPTPAGAISSELHGVDCPTSTFCMAVGSYALSAGEPQWAWSASWNGSSWTLRTVPKPPVKVLRSVLLDASCSSASSCTGVGGFRNGSSVQESFVQRWNGTSWSYQASPNPALSTNTVFQNISCTSGAPCIAVGDWNNGKGWQPMAQEWNGSAWALDTTPVPLGATETILEGVACRTGCLSVGWYKDSGGKLKTLGESR
jgi:hypothetical protein